MSYPNTFKSFGIKETVKLVMIPKGRNQILLRIENIGDIYDNNSKTYNVSLLNILDSLWKSANI